MGIFTEYGYYIVHVVPSDAAVSPPPHCTFCVKTIPEEFSVSVCYRKGVLVSARRTVHPTGFTVKETEGLNIIFHGRSLS